MPLYDEGQVDVEVSGTVVVNSNGEGDALLLPCRDCTSLCSLATSHAANVRRILRTGHTARDAASPMCAAGASSCISTVLHATCYEEERSAALELFT
jgi:hypothetical protein